MYKKIVIKRILKTLVGILFSYGGLGWVIRALARGKRQIPSVRILLYHCVNNQHNHFLTVTVDNFKYQMERLARYYKTISLNQLVHRCHGFALFPLDMFCPVLSARLSIALDRLNSNPLAILAQAILLR